MSNLPRRSVRAAFLLATVTALAGCGDDGSGGSSAYPRDRELRLNHIQVLGSHNSYHIRPQGRLGNALPIREWRYTHIPLDQQFETQGVRQIEIDVYADPEGGKYARPGGAVRLGDPFDVPELNEPGFKVLHVQDLDFQSNCWTFKSCMQTVRTWSDAHPGHVPITILIEGKDTVDVEIPGFVLTTPIPLDAAQLDALEAEILAVFPREKLITPDDVRGSRATLREAIETDGWPTLGETRGKILFLLDNGGRIKEAYLAGHPSLRGRLIFTSSEPPADEAAFVKLNSSKGEFDQIQDYVARGYIVRTRADSDTSEARTGDVSSRDAAIASAAQFVSTDYPVPDPAFGTGYFVQIPGGTPARCNPISAPPDCTSTDIENPLALVP